MADLISRLEGERIIPLAASDDDGGLSVEGLTSLSADTVKRCYPELIIKLSARRIGVKLRSALAIADGTAAKTA